MVAVASYPVEHIFGLFSGKQPVIGQHYGVLILSNNPPEVIEPLEVLDVALAIDGSLAGIVKLLGNLVEAETLGNPVELFGVA